MWIKTKYYSKLSDAVAFAELNDLCKWYSGTPAATNSHPITIKSPLRIAQSDLSEGSYQVHKPFKWYLLQGGTYLSRLWLRLHHDTARRVWDKGICPPVEASGGWCWLWGTSDHQTAIKPACVPPRPSISICGVLSEPVWDCQGEIQSLRRDSWEHSLLSTSFTADSPFYFPPLWNIHTLPSRRATGDLLTQMLRKLRFGWNHLSGLSELKNAQHLRLRRISDATQCLWKVFQDLTEVWLSRFLEVFCWTVTINKNKYEAADEAVGFPTLHT